MIVRVFDGLSGVLIDFAGTLFAQEDDAATLRAIGVPEAAWPTLLGAFARLDTLIRDPRLLPGDVRDCWARRDLSPEQHRAAWLRVMLLVGVPSEVAERFYVRSCSQEAWFPFRDTELVLRELHDRGLRIAVVSNIAWDLRPTFQQHGLLDLVDVFTLSWEVGATKPDPLIFLRACAAIDLPPTRVLMIGDNPAADGGAAAIGCRFLHLPPPRAADGLTQALGLTAGI